MTGPSRRDALFGAAAGSLELAPFLRPAKAAPAADVGPIEAGYAEFEVLAKAHDEACEVTWAAEARYVEPERPGWHYVHDEGGYRSIETSPGRGIVVLDDRPENIDRLTKIIARMYEPDTQEGTRNKVSGRRARRTLAEIQAWQIQAWQAEVRRRKKVAGLTAAQEVEERAGSAARTKAKELLAIEPTSYREAAFLAAIVSMGHTTTRRRTPAGRPRTSSGSRGSSCTGARRICRRPNSKMQQARRSSEALPGQSNVRGNLPLQV